jgi:hypothetical protein
MVSVAAKFRGAVDRAGNIIGSRALPLIPDSAKRVVVGRRSIMVDGNTLDPTLQMMLAARKAMEMNDLTDGEDPMIMRGNTSTILLQFDRRQIVVGGVDDLAIPGPRSDRGPALPAGGQRPGTADGLLSRRRIYVRQPALGQPKTGARTSWYTHSHLERCNRRCGRGCDALSMASSSTTRPPR